MFNPAVQPAGFAKFDADAFDTDKITQTLNRLLAESAKADHAAEVVSFRVIGYHETAPTTLRVIATLRYQANNCLAEVPYDVDAGALKGLEAGIGMD